ncbi:hypothetical protein PNIG_a1035 [Pseudoalteromonas nigrifaciens]|uniref:Uncharacterized protein n=1 Tax=Pseudoalteromonas nigrifaciens TaxID=28109 RepID=A0AAC9UI79_9GAMM|nr:hypothetical protein PNIG_a1035 [Pseudoalteromonas nigrifaciens]
MPTGDRPGIFTFIIKLKLVSALNNKKAHIVGFFNQGTSCKTIS